MREILFRGKCVDNGEWVYGYYAVKGARTDCEKHFICVSTFDARTNCYPFYFTDFEVDPETVGQYTGLPDRVGTKAFEYDCIHELYGNSIGVICYGEYKNPFNDDDFTRHIGFYVDWVCGKSKDVLRKDLGYWLNLAKIIGNIYDNPELL